MNDSVRQSHLCCIHVSISIVLQPSFRFLRHQTSNLTDAAGITHPHLPQMINFLGFL